VHGRRRLDLCRSAAKIAWSTRFELSTDLSKTGNQG
jgi:hypothetical protein